ncbi:hypothetical protein J0H58_28345 [bacterium]|nr:hypothetical protein [bacterium]
MGDFTDNITVRDAAAELGVTKARVDQYIRDGKLTVAATAGGLRWLNRKAVAAFKAVRTSKPGPKPGAKRTRKKK